MIYIPQNIGQIIDIFSIAVFFCSVYYFTVELHTRWFIAVSIISTLLISYVDLMFNAASEILIIIIYVACFKFKNLNFRRVLILIASFLITLISANVAGLSSLAIFNVHESYQNMNWALFCLYQVGTLIVITTLQISLIELATRQIKRFEIFRDELTQAVLMLTTAELFTFLIMSLFIARLAGKINDLLATILAIFFVLAIISFTITGKLMSRKIKELKLQRQQESDKYYSMYIQQTSQNVAELQKFHHDNKNFLLSLSYTAEQEHFPEFSKQIDTYLSMTNDYLQKIDNDSGVNLIENKLIRNILIIKLAQAAHSEVRVKVEIPHLVKGLQSKSIDLIRILGNLLDNAIRAAKNSDDKQVVIAITQDQDATEVTIRNSVNKENKTFVPQMFQRGYSTKEKKSGLGLASVQELVTHNNFSLIAERSDFHFTVTLSIPNN